MLPWRITSIVVCSLLFYWIVPLVSLVHQCPVSTHYPFACSACLSFSEHNSTQSAAAQECQMVGGALVTVQEELEWEMLQLYLESLNLSTTQVWVGYRLEGGEMVGEQWKNAPSSVVESVQRSLAVRGSEAGECVTVWGGEMVTAECSEEHRYVCVFNYPGENSYCDCPCETVHAPSLAVSYPRPGYIYHPQSLTLSLEVFISGSGITHLEWRRGHVPLAPSLTVEMRTRHDKTWAMLNVSSDSSQGYRGLYELLVTNPAGRTVVATWTVQPASLGSFTRSPQDLTIAEGSIAFFECSAGDAVPAPTYTWFKEGNPVVADKTRVYVSNVTHTLLMRDVVPEDAGSYSCRVENSAGDLTSPSATLTVRPQLEFEGSTPQFLLHPRNITLLEGSLYSMECVALHTSREFSYFLKMFRLSTAFDYPEFGGIPVLTIGSVSLEDSGKMMVCYGGVPFMIFSPSERGHLTVHSHPHVNHLATTIGNGTGPHSIPYTTNLAVECSFGGVPLPSQRWYRDGTVISSEGGVELGSGERKGSTELVLLEPVSGVYQCHVGNQYGSVISTTAICVHNVPGPTPFSVIADSTTSLYVAWSSPQPPSIHPLLLRYEILTTHTLTDLTFSSGTLPPSSSPWVVEGLNASSEYRVRVKSWSPLGQGAHGPEQTAYTYGPAPKSSPLDFLNVTVSRTHQNEGLVIQWHPTLPPPLGTVFAYYQVQYRTVGEKGEGLTEQVDAGQDWVFIDQLENAHSYEIRLRVKVQVQRYPAEFDPTPWSVWMPVEGVTTPPPLPSSSPTPSIGPSEAVEEESDREKVLLVAVLVPVLSVVLLVVLLVPVTVGGWRFWAKRRAASYTPSRLERQRIKGKQVPMGKDVFTLEPNLTAAVLAAEEEGAYCTMSTLRTTISTSRPSSRSDDLTTPDSPTMHTSNAE